MALKPQDIVILLYLCTRSEPWTVQGLAQAVVMSASEVHHALKRSAASGLYNTALRRPSKADLKEFLMHGLRYVFPVERGAMTRGTPTAHAAPPLKGRVIMGSDEPPPVWPDAKGQTRGEAWPPLYPTVPQAALAAPALYELLALADTIRGGRPRERELALEELSRRLG